MEWIIVLVVIVLAVFAAAWLGQEQMIFFPQPVGSTPHLPARASTLEVVGADGTRLRGWIVPAAATPAPTVIYFGGNAEEVSWTLSDARWPREWTIVGVNYRGYGTSEGKPGEGALKADAIVRREDVDAHHIVVFGRSLGTGVAVHVAAERPVARVVLASPYDSFVALGRKHYPWLPVSLLLRHRFDAAADAMRCRMPLLAIVGEYDTIIPADRSRALYVAWAGPKTWLSVPGADHNDLGDAEAFWAGVARFLAERG